jgi:hypothetical protein
LVETIIELVGDAPEEALKRSGMRIPMMSAGHSD